MPAVTIDGVVLDHVAHAVPRWQDAWQRYAVDLGAAWSSGGLSTGFAPAQLEFANGGRLEMLAPHDTTINDFLARFLAANGPGPHHLTFKVPDLALALDQLGRTPYDPIGVDLRDPQWMEAFIHPRQATGVVVQLAQAGAPWSDPPPDGFPTDRRHRADGSGPVPPASLLRVTHCVDDLDAGTALFVEVLGGSVATVGQGPDHRWTDVHWGGPLEIRLVAPEGDDPSHPLRQWLRGRTGRVHHLDLAADEPGSLPGARPLDEPVLGPPRPGPAWIIPAEVNLGLGLVVVEPG